MSCIVINGMHRSGTSLVTSVLQSLGVHIGDELLPPTSSNANGFFENVKFYRLNMDILKAAGGNWVNPPSEAAIRAVKPQFKGRILRTIQEAKKPLYGWKDPRTSLTIPLYLPHLEEPRFVLVYRKTEAIVGSLQKRSGSKGKEKWERLTRIYHASMEKWATGYPTFRVNYEDLVCKALACKEVKYLNLFVGGNGQIERAMENIHYRL